MVSSPKPPDPYKQAAAQQGAELGASMGSSIINNPNQYNPYGSQTYSVAGYETIYDAQGKPQYVPRYNQTTTLSPDQMKLLGLQTGTQYNLGLTGLQQSAKLKDYLGKSVDTSGVQGWSTGKAPGQMQTSFGGWNPMQMQVAGGGPIQKGISGYGNVQKGVGSGGAIRQDQGATDRRAIESAMLSRYREQAGKAASAEDAQLAARGLNPGSAQYGSVADTRARALTDATNQAYLASGAESRAAQDAYNQAQQQRYGQGLASGQFANAAQQQAYQQALGAGQFANAAQLQQFGQNAAQGQFANAAQQQAYQQALQRAGFANEATQGNYQMQQAQAAFLNQLRQAQMQERMGLRNQPLNEISALMSGGQVTTPQFNPFSAQGIGAAPIGSYIGQNYANQANAAAQSNAGLFGLGGSLLGGLGSGGFFNFFR